MDRFLPRMLLCLWSLFGAIVLASSAAGQEPLKVDSWPAGIVDRSNLPSDRSFDYDFRAVEVDDIEGWMRWINIELPVDASGQLSGWLWAQRSAEGWLDFGNYRIEGEVSSPQLKIDTWAVERAVLRFGYVNGKWYVGRLDGAVTSSTAQDPVGQFRVAAKLDLANNQRLETSGSITNISFGALLRSLGVEMALASGGGSVQFSGDVPLASASQLANWSATAKLQLADVAAANFPAADVTVDARVKAGQWSITNGLMTLADQRFSLSGTGRLDQAYPYNLALTSENLALGELLRDAGQAVLHVTGEVKLNVTASGDANAGLSEAIAQVSSEQLSIRSQTFDGLQLRVSYKPDSIQLDFQAAQIASGSLAGQLAWSSTNQLLDGLPQSAELSLSGMQLERLSRELVPISLSGVASGEIALQSEIRDGLTHWATQGNLNVAALAAEQTVIGDAKVTLSKDVDSPELQIELSAADQTITAKLAARLQDRDGQSVGSTELIHYQATGQFADFRTQLHLSRDASNQLPVSVTGRFDLHGEPEHWLKSGSAELLRATVKIGDETVTLQTALVDISPREFRLRQFQIFAQRGRIAGSAILCRDQHGVHQLNLRVANVQVEKYAKSWLPSELSSIRGRVSTELRLTKEAASLEPWLGWQGSLTGEAVELRYKGVSLGNLSLVGQLDDDMLAGNLTGDLLGGEASLSTTVPLELSRQFAPSSYRQKAGPARQSKFDAQLTGLDLRRLIAMVSDQRTAAPFAGLASLQAKGQATNPDDLLVDLQLQIPLLRHQQTRLARDLLARFSYFDRELQIEELSGGFAGGRLKARGVCRIPSEPDGSPSGELMFNAQRLRVQDLAAIFLPDDAEQFEGLASYRGSVRLDRQVHISGNARLNDATTYGLPIENAYADVRVAVEKDLSKFRLSSNDIHGTAVGGRLGGEFELRGSSRVELKARGSLSDGKLEQLSKSLGFEHIIGSGRFNGAIDLQSRDVTSLGAYQGRVQVDFTGGDVQAVPVLSDLGRYVPVLQLASTDLSGGTLHAAIGQGQLRIRDFLINSDSFWMAGNGNASLTGGRLDIDALLQTGGGIEQQLTQSAVQKLAIVIVPEAALLAEFNDLIRNRSLYFHIGGTARQPAIQARVAQTASAALLQTVRRQLLLPTTAASATAITSGQ